jgi:hypothetical protein
MANVAHGAPYAVVLFAVAAVALFATGHVLARRKQAAPSRIGSQRKGTMLSLMEAAKAVHEAATREGMVIATVADKSGSADPIAWFAQSIAGVVPVYRMNEAKTFEKLEGTTDVGGQSQSLYIRKSDYKTYVAWARSMQ